MTSTRTAAGRAALGGALTAAAIGALVLLGWMLGSDAMVRILPSFVAMHPTTAVGLLLAGSSLSFSLCAPVGRAGSPHRIAARTAALAVTLIGVLRISGLLGGWDLHVTEWLFASEHPVPVAATTAANFLLIGVALGWVDAERRGARLVVEWVSIAVGFVSLLTVLAYAYDVETFYRVGPVTPMALHTGLALALLAGAVLFSHTDQGLLAVFAGPSAGGKVARRLLPAAILMPAVIGGLMRGLEGSGSLHDDFSDTLAAIFSVAVFVVLVSWSAKELSGADDARASAENLFALMFEHAPIGVALVDLGGRFVRVNQALCDLVGYSEPELTRMTFSDVTRNSQSRLDLASAQRMLRGDVHAYQTEKQYAHKSGRLVTVLMSTSLIRDPQGRPRHFVTQVQDISARAGAEVAAIEARRFLKSTLDALSAHIAILDEHGTIVEVNDAWETFARRNAAPHGWRGIGESYLDVCDAASGQFGDEAPTAARGIRAVMSRAIAEFHLEYPCHGPAELRWFVMRVTRFSGDGPVRVVIAHVNITERREAENALRASDEKFHQLADHITDVFWIRSPDMHEVQYVSPAFATIWGRPVELLYTQPHLWEAFIVPADRARVKAAFAALTTDEGHVDIEYRISRPDGEERWIRVRGFQVRGASLELVRHVGIVTDITEQKLSDRARETSEERFRNFFELGLIGMAITSPEKGCLAVNDRLCEILGYAREELLRIPWTAFTHPDDLADEMRRFDALLAGSSDGYSIDKRFIRKDGRIIYAAISVRCVRRTDQSIDYLLSLVQDVTDRKHLELQLFQSQKLESAARLAGGIAHEFNSVLTSIIGHGESLSAGLPADSALRQHAAEIRQAADRAAALTRQLLAYGRRQLLRPERLNLNAVIARLDGSLRHVVGAGAEVRVIAAPGLAPVRADVGQIEQVVMNLAMNAADAMPHGGTLTLQTSNVTIDEVHAVPDLRAGMYVALDVIDTGIGLSSTAKAHLFEPFFTTKAVGQGTGLGLSTCYGIIRQSGGHISVRSELGHGAAFRVYLPQAASWDEPALARLDSPELPRGTETILLVEADAALRDVAATLLRRLGYRVETAGDDAEAGMIAALGGVERIDLVFRDGVKSFPPSALARRVRMLLDSAISS